MKLLNTNEETRASLGEDGLSKLALMIAMRGKHHQGKYEAKRGKRVYRGHRN